ncbi:MAG: hypothetical protein QOH34_2341 [Mycobacterium sp.]|nr:hypothetical protein [Mycobacterium sp.]
MPPKWAVDEAISRQIPLRLVHGVGRSKAQSALACICDWEVECGETALDQAEVAVQGVGKPVEVATVLLSGDPEQVLINESPDAARVCVGTDRRGWAADKLLGTTEAALATRAHCPVAIIRTSPDATAAKPGVIAVVLNDEPDNDEVVHQAIEEGRRRNATVRQIDRRLTSWVRRYPDVPFHCRRHPREVLRKPQQCNRIGHCRQGRCRSNRGACYPQLPSNCGRS